MPLTRQYLLLAAAEGTYGTPATLTGADAHLVTKMAYKIDSTPYYRPAGSGVIVPGAASQIQKKRTSFSFASELKGNSVTLAAGKYPDYHAFLQACGFAASYSASPTPNWTYTRDTYPAVGATIQAERGGLVVQGYGCRGNIKIDFVPGEIVKPQWDFKGLYSAPTNGGLTTPDYTADVLPPVLGTTGFDPWTGNLLAGQFGHIRKASLDLRNNVVYQESMTVGSYGVSGVHILGYGSEDDPGSILTVEIECGSTTDEWYDRWESREIDDTTADLAITVGSALNNTHKFQFGRLYVRTIEPIDMDGRMGFTIEFGLLRTAAASTIDDLVIVAS